MEVIFKENEQHNHVRYGHARAREIQVKRFQGVDGVDCNARLPDGLFSMFCPMAPSAETLFMKAQKSLLVSAWARGHIVRVARTIADLDCSETIAERYIMEAVGYRGGWLRIPLVASPCILEV